MMIMNQLLLTLRNLDTRWKPHTGRGGIRTSGYHISAFALRLQRKGVKETESGPYFPEEYVDGVCLSSPSPKNYHLLTSHRTSECKFILNLPTPSASHTLPFLHFVTSNTIHQDLPLRTFPKSLPRLFPQPLRLVSPAHNCISPETNI